MTQEIASISFKVSTSELEKGSKALNDLQQAASRTDQSVDELNSTFKQSEPAHKAAARAVAQLTKEQKEVVESVKSMNENFSKNAKSLRDEIQAINKAGNASSKFAEILKKPTSTTKTIKLMALTLLL
ncbi:hypothetical protein AB6G19_05965 [Providencia manganoxydans]